MRKKHYAVLIKTELNPEWEATYQNYSKPEAFKLAHEWAECVNVTDVEVRLQTYRKIEGGKIK